MIKLFISILFQENSFVHIKIVLGPVYWIINDDDRSGMLNLVLLSKRVFSNYWSPRFRIKVFIKIPEFHDNRHAVSLTFRSEKDGCFREYFVRLVVVVLWSYFNACKRS
jgi:hypothetical protein